MENLEITHRLINNLKLHQKYHNIRNAQSHRLHIHTRLKKKFARTLFLFIRMQRRRMSRKLWVDVTELSLVDSIWFKCAKMRMSYIIREHIWFKPTFSNI